MKAKCRAHPENPEKYSKVNKKTPPVKMESKNVNRSMDSDDSKTRSEKSLHRLSMLFNPNHA